MLYPAHVLNILRELGIHSPILLGRGGEGLIFEYTNTEVIKIFTKETINIEYLNHLSKILVKIQSHKLPIQTPLIKDIGNKSNTLFTIEKRLNGRNMETVFPTLEDKKKRKLIRSYLNAIKYLHTITFPSFKYGNILPYQDQITDEKWSSYLCRKAKQRVESAGKKLEDDYPQIHERLLLFNEIVDKYLIKSDKCLVHCDYFVNQVLVNESHEITAILDISYHAAVGDPKLDIASTPIFYGLKEYTPDLISYIKKIGIREYGDEIIFFFDIYQIYYCFYFSNIYKYLPDFYREIVQTLRDQQLWNRVSHPSY